MKNYEKVFLPENEKKAQKLVTALQNGCGFEYLDQFREEAAKETATDLPKLGAMVTESFLACYSAFNKKQVYIIPLADVINVYSSNCFNGKYDYDNKAITVETRYGATYYAVTILRNQKLAEYGELIEVLQNRCKDNEGSLMA